MRRKRHRLRNFLFLAATLFALLYAFYWHFSQIEDDLISQHHMSGERANAVKHAYAAAEIYRGFTKLGIGSKTATDGVLWLGQMNEYMEQIIRYGFGEKRDTISEMVKDMRNNQSGVLIAQWHKHHVADIPDMSLRALLLNAADAGLLTENEEKSFTLTTPLGEGLSNVGRASESFRSGQNTYGENLITQLEQHFVK